jgi:hypothetical protein
MGYATSVVCPEQLSCMQLISSICTARLKPGGLELRAGQAKSHALTAGHGTGPAPGIRVFMTVLFSYRPWRISHSREGSAVLSWHSIQPRSSRGDQMGRSHERPFFVRKRIRRLPFRRNRKADPRPNGAARAAAQGLTILGSGGSGGGASAAAEAVAVAAGRNAATRRRCRTGCAAHPE